MDVLVYSQITGDQNVSNIQKWDYIIKSFRVYKVKF
jgi:hypothetical protein